jgi:hypothetical protein
VRRVVVMVVVRPVTEPGRKMNGESGGGIGAETRRGQGAGNAPGRATPRRRSVFQVALAHGARGRLEARCVPRDGISRVASWRWRAFDSQQCHNHWHFEQFARYALLNSAKSLAVRSHKVGFCIGASDAVDLLLRHAEWQPPLDEPAISCGSPTALGYSAA